MAGAGAGAGFLFCNFVPLMCYLCCVLVWRYPVSYVTRIKQAL